MTIEKEEIFGPVLSVISYENEDEAVKIANDTVYGLAAYVQSQNIDHARAVAARMRAGQVNINYPDWDTFAPFGGYKQSGNGREYADWASTTSSKPRASSATAGEGRHRGLPPTTGRGQLTTGDAFRARPRCV